VSSPRRVPRGRLLGIGVPHRGDGRDPRIVTSPRAPIILEPIMKVELQARKRVPRHAIGLLKQRRGVILSSEGQDKYFVAQANVPFFGMFGFSTVLRSATQGKGEFSMEFASTSRCPRKRPGRNWLRLTKKSALPRASDLRLIALSPWLRKGPPHEVGEGLFIWLK